MKAMGLSFMGSLVAWSGRCAFRGLPRCTRRKLTTTTSTTTSSGARPSLLCLAAVTGIAFSANTTTALAPSSDAVVFPPQALELDNYNGVILKVNDAKEDKRFQDAVAFGQLLGSCLEQWNKEGKRGIWVHVPTQMAHLVPICVSNGFEFHSAKEGTLVLTRWLPDTPSRLPLGPSHQVGVGCLVTRKGKNDDNEMLVVQERTGPAALYKLWKMPTGLLDPGESIREAAERELKEETGLDGTLYKILAFRQAHATRGGGTTGVSDLFFVCWIQLKDHDAYGDRHVWNRQEEEIADIRWMSMKDYADQALWKRSPVYKEMNTAMIRAVQSDVVGMEETTLPLGFRPGTNTIYIPAKI
mmetsp:Transcript_8699/g.20108  ORF Transcript_8699/g.20108 Transcript_8699/m.20108 type:complete len:356 (-) Transcript_8699:176-1243(-)